MLGKGAVKYNLDNSFVFPSISYLLAMLLNTITYIELDGADVFTDGIFLSICIQR
jgi:hypothetical protein